MAAELKRPRDLPAVINTPVELHGGHLPRHGEAFYEGAWTTLTVEFDVRVGNVKARTLFRAFNAMPLSYPYFSLDHLVLSRNRNFDRLAFFVGPGSKDKRQGRQ